MGDLVSLELRPLSPEEIGVVWVYVNRHHETVRLFGPPPDLHFTEGFGVLVRPGNSVEFNTADVSWLTVHEEAGDVLESGYVFEVAEEASAID